MRILHVIDSLSASGGAEHGMVREVTRFSPDHEQMVVRLFARDDLQEHLETAGIDVHPLGLASSHSGWNWPEAVRRLSSVIDDFRPDVIQSSLFSSNVVAQYSARRKEVPVLSTFTLSGDPRLLRAYQPGADSFRATVLRKVAGHAARSDRVWFRALTHDALHTNCRLLGVDENRASVIPRGIPLVDQGDSATSREDLGLPPGVPLLVNVGRQTAQKGHVSLVEAFAIVRETAPAHLVILGREGDGSASLRDAIAAHGLEGDVTVIPYTPHVADYLAMANAFVFSSYMEGLGTAVLEAMNAGAPVVAFDIPPVREATAGGRLARLVPVGDVHALAEAVLDAIASAGNDIHVAEARQWVAENYSLDRVAGRVEELLLQVADSRQRT